MTRLGLLALLLLLVAGCGTTAAASGPGAASEHGGYTHGAPYRIEVPPHWNGTLLLYSHGYASPQSGMPGTDAPSRQVATSLLAAGYALAGSAYSQQGWSVEQALGDQLAVLDAFAARVGRPRRTIAWGSSMGGLVTALLAERHPDRFQSALPMCGGLAGGTAVWNLRLDGAFAFRTLLAPRSELQLTGIRDPAGNVRLAKSIAKDAQATPAGRARLALAAAIQQLPTWLPKGLQEEQGAPAQERAQYQSWVLAALGADFANRAELEERAGGNPSWNTGVDYAGSLQRSGAGARVASLYAQAGLSLPDDLARLARAPRISPDRRAVRYLERYGTPNGRLRVPVLSLHTVADGQNPAANEATYASAVAANSDPALLRQLFVARGGHCSFTPAEQVDAVGAVTERLESGRWPAWVESAGAPSDQAAGPPTGVRFVSYHPSPVSRPGTTSTTRP
jgi:pimeloyl-ACP methyl ester carboxylesterase